MNGLTRDAVLEAIRTTEKNQRVHQDWIDWLRSRPEWAQELKPRIDVGGNVAHHEQCIAEYDVVLDVLRRVVEGFA